MRSESNCGGLDLLILMFPGRENDGKTEPVSWCEETEGRCAEVRVLSSANGKPCC
jgi:hypothetical protein